MIKTFHVQNYKALRDVTLELTPLHVLIGPNDSGKTSLLEALRAWSRIASGQDEAFDGRWTGRQLAWRQADSEVTFDVTGRWDGREVRHFTRIRFPASGRSIRVVQNEVTPIEPPTSFVSYDAAVAWLQQGIGPTQFYRWIPSQLALPVAFDFPRQFGMDPSGFGLAMLLNDILTGDYKRFGELDQRFCAIFPSLRGIRLERETGFLTVSPNLTTAKGLGIYFEQVDGERLPAAQASDGMMLVLAYLAILFSPKPPGLLLIEEPENGVHPRRLKEVLQILRELVSEQGQTQVILTTHSPYVVDLFKPEEVTLCLKGADGAVTAHRLSDSKSVREQMDIFQLGEIWTAEGDEALAAPAKAQEAAST